MQQTRFYLMINFKLMKIFIFLCFHAHKNSKLNLFNPISKVANFGVLQFYPLKINLVSEIRKTSTERQGYFVFRLFFTLSCSSIVLIRIPLYFAYLLILLQVTCQTNSKIMTGTLRNSQVTPITRPHFLQSVISILLPRRYCFHAP